MLFEGSVLKEQRRAFGRDTSASDTIETQMIRKVLQRRQGAKIRNFERIAARLQMRGEKDAATVLKRAAERLRAISAAE